ncbi:Leucine-rich repeat extensin-like protein 6 [Zea mays]|uniref:Leucine-rich repeat extensin-like protein 6 n=1 Tax=Zea mays TaxID=4577 RepID=A0A1D6H6J4_MAIZE|nr:Leucine-rich repeat extensin-like protein 6 [Zea mays]
MRLLHELDVSNNRLSGGFPQHILCLPSVRYVDLRFNDLRGLVPPTLFDKPLDAIFLNDSRFDFELPDSLGNSPALFDKPLDAIFVNDRRFDFELPDSLGNSPASVLVLANLRLRGCIPRSVGRMAGTLAELVALNSGLRSCLPQELGWLRELTRVPESMAGLHGLQQLHVERNELWGHVPEGVCALPALRNFTYSYNYFCSEPSRCLDVLQVDDRQNCIAARFTRRVSNALASASTVMPPSPGPSRRKRSIQICGAGVWSQLLHGARWRDWGGGC